ncbi:Transcription factor SAC51 [Spatholobus suberectus]|nr:Transcription factor SAC51 [Spatholobus suberectus]
MVCQAASQTRFRALKHENGIEEKQQAIEDPISRHHNIYLYAHWSWPYPQHVARPSPYLNCSCTSAEPSLQIHSACMNPSTCILPAVSVFPSFTAPAIPNLKTEQTDEVQGFLQYPNSEPCLKETHTGGAIQNANHASLQKKLLIFDHSGSKTRLLYSPVFPLVQSPTVSATQFAQVYDVNEEAQATNMGLKHIPVYTSPEETGKDHIDNDESEMHEDTEEINALLYSDDDDDEVTSTGHSPLVTKRTYVTQKQFADMKEEVASSDWPNKKQKLIDGGYNRLPPLVDSATSERLNETCEYVTDAELKYFSSGGVYAARQTKEDNLTAADIQLKKDKIRELLRVLENFIPGAKGKHPLLVIDGTIEYLKSLMSQTGTLKYH